MPKLYRYTLLKQDGTKYLFPTSKKKDFKELYEILNCSTIEIIPSDYYPDEFGKCTVYGDEEGRFVEGNVRNPHMKALKGNPALGEAPEWDTVGDLVMEEAY